MSLRSSLHKHTYAFTCTSFREFVYVSRRLNLTLTIITTCPTITFALPLTTDPKIICFQIWETAYIPSCTICPQLTSPESYVCVPKSTVSQATHKHTHTQQINLSECSCRSWCICNLPLHTPLWGFSACERRKRDTCRLNKMTVKRFTNNRTESIFGSQNQIYILKKKIQNRHTYHLTCYLSITLTFK